MAGHSKWANIKHKKAKQDAKRGKVWTKIIREVTIAARLGGGVIADNPRLRLATDKAFAANMPKDTIERAIARGAGGADGADVEELTYEGYGPGGVAILIEAMTDNRNRTVAEVRHAFSKKGGNLGTDGSVAYLFQREGLITVAAGAAEETLMDAALEAGAQDIEQEADGSFSVTVPWESLSDISDALAAAGFTIEDAEISMVPSTTADVEGETAEQVVALLEMLEDLDDVQNVYSNAGIPEDLL